MNVKRIYVETIFLNIKCTLIYLCSKNGEMNVQMYKHHTLLINIVQTMTDVFKDGWMTCDFTSFLTVFQSYQDDRRTIMKGCVLWNPVYG